MYRVVTKHQNQYGHWIAESGPWHISREDAENWASILNHMGYQTHVEGHEQPVVDEDDDDLQKALASLA